MKHFYLLISFYLQLNPQHTVPFLDDNGVLITDSHAICAYLSEKFGKTDRLYPKDLVRRAQVDARMHFDSGHLFARLRFLFEPVLFHKQTELPADRVQYIQTAWDILERFVETTAFVCGDEMTIADFCLIATASSVCDIAPLDPVKHANIIRWMDRMSKLRHYEEINGARAKALQDLVRDTLTKNAK